MDTLAVVPAPALGGRVVGMTGSVIPYGREYEDSGKLWADEDNVTRHDDDGTARAVGLLDGLRNGEWLQRQVFPPLRFAVPGLIPEGMTLLVGPPKAGKSWAALDIALAVASGGVAFGGIPVGPARPVLYMALEDGDRRLQDRCRKLLGAETAIPAQFQYLTRMRGTVIPTISAWLDTVAPGADPLVIVDTLGKVTPSASPGENQYHADYRFASALKAAADGRPGCALLALHHDRKAASADFVDSVSGTKGVTGAVDTVLVLVRVRNQNDGVLKVTGRDIHEDEYAVNLGGGMWRITGGNLGDAARAAATMRTTANLGDRSAEVCAIVAEHPDGVSPSAIATRMGIDRKAAAVALGRLVDSGRINKGGRGKYLPTPHVVSVVSDDSDDDLLLEYNGDNGYDTAR